MPGKPYPRNTSSGPLGVITTISRANADINPIVLLHASERIASELPILKGHDSLIVAKERRTEIANRLTVRFNSR